MSENIWNSIGLAGIFLVLFASAEWLYHKREVKAEVTRKYVHLSTGLLVMLFPPFIQNHWLVLLLCGSFLLILLTSLRYNFLPSIHAVDRETRGSLLFPIIVYGCFLIYNYYGQYIFYYIPILILAICDPVAALVGKRWPKGTYTTFGQTKTWIGSFGFFVAAMITCWLLTTRVDGISWYHAGIVSLAVSLVTTIAEALTHKGYDNLTIPAGAILTLMVLDYYTLLV